MRISRNFISFTAVITLLFLFTQYAYHTEMNKPVFTTTEMTVENEIIGTFTAMPEIELEELVYDPLLNVRSTEMELPQNPKYHGTKSYEYYTAITSKRSKQYQLQGYAVTDEKGFRKVEDRYLIAVGTYFHAPVGTYLDVILENGMEIPCMVGDIKSDKDTDNMNVFSQCGCASEFMVDRTFVKLTGCRGDVSKVMDGWNSKVKVIRVYEKNYLN